MGISDGGGTNHLLGIQLLIGAAPWRDMRDRRKKKITIKLGLGAQLLIPFLLWYGVRANIHIGHLSVAYLLIGCAGAVLLLHVWEQRAVPLWAVFTAYLLVGYWLGMTGY